MSRLIDSPHDLIATPPESGKSSNPGTQYDGVKVPGAPGRTSGRGVPEVTHDGNNSSKPSGTFNTPAKK